MRAGMAALGGDNPFGARLVSAFAGRWGPAWSSGGSGGRSPARRPACSPAWRWRRSRSWSPSRSWRRPTRRSPCWSSRPRRALGLSRTRLGPDGVRAFWARWRLATLLKGPVGPALVAASGSGLVVVGRADGLLAAAPMAGRAWPCSRGRRSPGTWRSAGSPRAGSFSGSRSRPRSSSGWRRGWSSTGVSPAITRP